MATAAVLVVGCGGGAAGLTAPTATPATSPAPSPRLAAVISERDGPDWTGRLGDAVRIDWQNAGTGEVTSERLAVLAVRRVAAAGAGGPYGWRYGIKVRLTGLSPQTARRPVAVQFLQLSDGKRAEDGVSGLGEPGGPDPSRAGHAATGWLYQRAEEGFRPTEVLLHVGPWTARWSLPGSD